MSIKHYMLLKGYLHNDCARRGIQLAKLIHSKERVATKATSVKQECTISTLKPKTMYNNINSILHTYTYAMRSQITRNKYLVAKSLAIQANLTI